MLLKTLAVRQPQSRRYKRTRIATFTGSAIRTPRTVNVLHTHCNRPRRLAARLVAHNRLCSATPPPPSASASRPSRTPRCPQIVSLGGANHRPWMRRGRRHQCAHATLHGLALRRGFRRLRRANRTGHLRFAITRDAFPIASRNPRQSGIWTAPPANSSLQLPSRPPLATRRGKKCRSMAGASTVRYRPVPAHHCQMTHACRASRRKARTRALKANCPGAH